MDLHTLRNRAREIAPLAAKIRELCGDDDLAFIDTLEGETDAVKAASQAVRMIAAMEAMETAAKALADRYGARAKDFGDRGQRARDAIAGFMQEIGEKSLTLPEGTVSLANSAPSLQGDAEPDALPDDLVHIKRTPDRTKIKAALRAGREVSGYSLSNGKPSLRIRTR
jgi:hypothetical protein